MEIHVTMRHKFRPIMFLTSYLCKSPAGDPRISDNVDLKNEHHFLTKKLKSNILTKS